MLLTITPTWVNHIEERTKKAKTSVYSAWGKLIKDENVNIQVKIAIFRSAIRGIQCYAGQVFGYGYDEIINKMQIFYLKHILRLPSFTPTYAVFLDTKETPTSCYTLKLHMEYIYKTIFIYEQYRLPNILSRKIIQKNIFWFKEWINMQNKTMVRWENVPLTKDRWKFCIKSAMENYQVNWNLQMLTKKVGSVERIYKYLSSDVHYLYSGLNTRENMYIFKSRCDLLRLNGNLFGPNIDKRCTICNINAIENVYHLVGECPKYDAIRLSSLGARKLQNYEVLSTLNGKRCSWKKLADFIKTCLNVRETYLK